MRPPAPPGRGVQGWKIIAGIALVCVPMGYIASRAIVGQRHLRELQRELRDPVAAVRMVAAEEIFDRYARDGMLVEEVQDLFKPLEVLRHDSTDLETYSLHDPARSGRTLATLFFPNGRLKKKTSGFPRSRGGP